MPCVNPYLTVPCVNPHLTVPSTLLAHAVLSAPAPTTTITKKVAVIKKRKIQAPVEEHPIIPGMICTYDMLFDVIFDMIYLV